MFDPKICTALLKRANAATEARELTGTIVTTLAGTSLVFPAIGDLPRVEVPIQPQKPKSKVVPDGHQP